jgi:hypothetical protein
MPTTVSTPRRSRLLRVHYTITAFNQVTEEAIIDKPRTVKASTVSLHCHPN